VSEIKNSKENEMSDITEAVAELRKIREMKEKEEAEKLANATFIVKLVFWGVVIFVVGPIVMTVISFAVLIHS
jgi:uncharacterized protein YqhQ